MTISEYFEKLKTKDIICWGSGKHFRNSTLPFLKKSGLIDNLRGFVDVPGTADIVLDDRSFDRVGKENLKAASGKNTIILIAVTGYEEILSQLQADSGLKQVEAVPSIYLEALYEDLLLLSADK